MVCSRSSVIDIEFMIASIWPEVSAGMIPSQATGVMTPVRRALRCGRPVGATAHRSFVRKTTRHAGAALIWVRNPKAGKYPNFQPLHQGGILVLDMVIAK